METKKHGRFGVVCWRAPQVIGATRNGGGTQKSCRPEICRMEKTESDGLNLDLHRPEADQKH